MRRRKRVPSFTADWPRPLRIAAAVVFLLAAPLWVWALVACMWPERAGAQWEEWMEAWRAYDAKFHGGQSAERIAERHGFGYSELVMLLGHEPKTWVAREVP